MRNSVISDKMDATEVSELIGHDMDVLSAMVRAESYGAAMAHGVRIIHKGYVRNAVEFNAGTSEFQLQY